MNKKMTFVAVFVAFFFAQCRDRNGSGLDHVDDPQKRGAEEEAPWHFHTGEGWSITEMVDSESGRSQKAKARCDVRKAAKDSDCKEKVYFFTAAEIQELVDAAYNIQASKLNNAAVRGAMAGSIAYYTGKGTIAALTTPEPGLSKVGAAIGGIATGALVVYVAWEGYNAAKASRNMRGINTMLEEQRSFVRRCRHLSKDFLSRAGAYGVQIQFTANGGEFIDAIDYQNSIKEELGVYEATLDYAIKNKVTSEQAYNSYFLKQCGQLPSTRATQSDINFIQAWKYIPQNLAKQSFNTSKAINLDSGNMVEYSKFDSNDFDSDGEQSGVMKFLRDVEAGFKAIDAKGTEKEKVALAKFRKQYRRIIIHPRWSGRDMFHGDYKNYEVVEDGGKYDLFINALWWSTYASYEITMKDFFHNEIGIEPSKYKIY